MNEPQFSTASPREPGTPSGQREEDVQLQQLSKKSALRTPGSPAHTASVTVSPLAFLHVIV